jgi:hypothetical protein
MIAPMKKAGAPLHTAAPELTRLEEFSEHLDKVGVELDAADRGKLRDLRVDTAGLCRRDLAGEGDRVGLPGYVFSCFESAVAARSIGAAWRDLRRRLRPGTDAPSFVAFAPDLAVFDRLSILFGNRYHCSLLVNYGFGALAVLVSLVPVVVAGMRSSGHAPTRLSMTAGVIEILLVVTISIIYFCGRTPEEHRGVHWAWLRVWDRVWPWAHSGQRWHQRWLEYRVLAERFRYLEILYPVVDDVSETWRAARGGRPSTDWVDRYFEWRIAAVKPDKPVFDDYLARLATVIKAQLDYHTRNAVRLKLIYERLHLTAGLLFGVTLVAIFIHVCVYLWAQFGIFGAAPEPSRGWVLLLLVTGGAPALAGAIHGFLNSSEYAKIVELSSETAKRIGEIDVAIKRAALSEARNRDDLAPIRKSVEAFFVLVSDEASGWKAMLRDKNVPLP